MNKEIQNIREQLRHKIDEAYLELKEMEAAEKMMAGLDGPGSGCGPWQPLNPTPTANEVIKELKNDIVDLEIKVVKLQNELGETRNLRDSFKADAERKSKMIHDQIREIYDANMKVAKIEAELLKAKSAPWTPTPPYISTI